MFNCSYVWPGMTHERAAAQVQQQYDGLVKAGVYNPTCAICGGTEHGMVNTKTRHTKVERALHDVMEIHREMLGRQSIARKSPV